MSRGSLVLRKATTDLLKGGGDETATTTGSVFAIDTISVFAVVVLSSSLRR